MSEVNNFFNEVFKKFNQDITDRIFLMIQNDPELMKKYLRLIENNEIGKDKLNKSLGKEVKNNYNLNNKKDENGEDKINFEPISTLISSYTEHK